MEGHAYTLNFYVYAWPFIHCLYFIYARKFYLRSHGKITRQWKSTPSQVFTCRVNLQRNESLKYSAVQQSTTFDVRQRGVG